MRQMITWPKTRFEVVWSPAEDGGGPGKEGPPEKIIMTGDLGKSPETKKRDRERVKEKIDAVLLRCDFLQPDMNDDHVEALFRKHNISILEDIEFQLDTALPDPDLVSYWLTTKWHPYALRWVALRARKKAMQRRRTYDPKDPAVNLIMNGVMARYMNFAMPRTYEKDQEKTVVVEDDGAIIIDKSKGVFHWMAGTQRTARDLQRRIGTLVHYGTIAEDIKQYQDAFGGGIHVPKLVQDEYRTLKKQYDQEYAKARQMDDTEKLEALAIDGEPELLAINLSMDSGFVDDDGEDQSWEPKPEAIHRTYLVNLEQNSGAFSKLSKDAKKRLVTALLFRRIEVYVEKLRRELSAPITAKNENEMQKKKIKRTAAILEQVHMVAFLQRGENPKREVTATTYKDLHDLAPSDMADKMSLAKSDRYRQLKIECDTSGIKAVCEQLDIDASWLVRRMGMGSDDELLGILEEIIEGTEQ